MIEFSSAIALFLITCLGFFTNLFDFKELFNTSYEALLLFTIFGRCFITIVNIQTVSDKKRLLFESIIFVFSTICLITLYLYHIDCIYFNTFYIQIFVFGACFIIFSTIKYYIIKHNIYGKKYLFLQILDIFIVLLCFICNFYINQNNISFKNIIFALFLVGILGALNKHIINKLEYWIALKGFIAEIKILTLNGNINRITYPPDKDINTDIIYSRCRIILEKCNIRVLETWKLEHIVYKTLISNGYSFKQAHKISSDFLGILSNNLMRRDLDAALIPTTFLNFIYNFKRKFIRLK